MTLLRGHFAWTLVVAVDSDVATLEASLDALQNDELKIAVVQLPAEVTASHAPTHWLSVHGSDRPGIVSAVTGEVAAVGGNITDLTTRLAGNLYVVLADVFLPPGSDVEDLRTVSLRWGPNFGAWMSRCESLTPTTCCSAGCLRTCWRSSRSIFRPEQFGRRSLRPIRY